MNRFAALDSDNEDEPKVASVTTDKKKKETASAAAPAAASNTASAKPAAGKSDAAPKKANADNKGKTEGKKPQNGGKAPVPGQKTDKPKPKAAAPAGDAAPAAGGDVMEASGSAKGEKRDNRNFGRGPRTRFEKRQDEKDPSIKPDNRIRGGAHGFNNKRRPSKNADKAEVDGIAKDGEKNPLGTEASEPVEGENEETSPEVTPEVPAEPEPATLTLDEYVRQREQARANSAVLGQAKTARVVEELTGLKIKEDDEAGVYTGAAKASKNTKASQRSTSKNVVVDLGFKVEDEQPQQAPRTAGSRDDKRAPQAGRNAGNNRTGPKSKGTRVDLADVNAFPSL